MSQSGLDHIRVLPKRGGSAACTPCTRIPFQQSFDHGLETGEVQAPKCNVERRSGARRSGMRAAAPVATVTRNRVTSHVLQNCPARRRCAPPPAYPSLVSADVQEVTDERATLEMWTSSAVRASVTARLVSNTGLGRCGIDSQTSTDRTFQPTHEPALASDSRCVFANFVAAKRHLPRALNRTNRGWRSADRCLRP